MKGILSISVSLFLVLAVSLLLMVSCAEEGVEATPEANITVATVEIPGGTFTMGSPVTEPNRNADEGPRLVTVSAFRMSQYEITNTEFAAFLNDKKVERYGHYPDGSEITAVLVKINTGWGVWYSDGQWLPVKGYENYPVVDVTWFGATEFATWAGGRLPTEAEWEYACRANTNTAFNTGSCLTDAQGNYAWNNPYNTCSNSTSSAPTKTMAVGSYAANAFGLYDMHGNVWEWCNDVFGNNPDLRVLRGGAWIEDAWVCRSANRFGTSRVSWVAAHPTIMGNVGFRVVF